MTPPPRGERPLPRLALGAVVLVLCVAAGLMAFGEEGDLLNEDVTFVDETQRTPAPASARAGSDGHPADDGFDWPVYGLTKSRTHSLALRSTPRPPFRQAWAVRGNVLLEFSPVMCRRKLYLLKNNAALYAISRTTGRKRWKRKLGSLAAAAPACGHGTVYSVVLERGRGVKGGRIVAVSAKSGRTRWSRKLPSRAESSPLLDRNRLFFGTEDGTIYALRASDGSVRWTAKAAGAVKGALALDSGKLFYGDYGGRVHAIRRSDGRKVWTVSVRSGPLGLRDGNFYSSAAVAYGRVYIGNTNGNVYSFSTADGTLAWRKRTGGFVYASPAVGAPSDGGPTVFVGSYDGRFYALDARTGRSRWVRSLGSKISGAATLVGDVVFVSDLDKRTTWALRARDGRTLWKTRRGGFQPAISDGRRVFFTAYSSLFALDPTSRRASSAKRRPSAPQRAAVAGARAARLRARVERRARDRERARLVRLRRFRTQPHGHRHARGGDPPRCHPHRHVYSVRGKRQVLRHSHCHTHVQRRR